jgi:hypothetical protein
MDPEDVANVIADLIDVSDPQTLTVDEAGVEENARTGGSFFQVRDQRGNAFTVEIVRSGF